MYSGSPLKGELGVADWISAITEFSRLGGKNVTISGGELTCKPGWLDVIRQAAEAGLRVTILTNGTIWTEADIQSTAQLVAEVQVSVDGTSEQSNAAIRGAGFYKKALNTALEFANRGVRTSIAMTPGADEIGALAENIVAFDQHLRSRANGPIFIKISSNLIEGRHGSALPPEKLKLYEDAAKAASDRLYGNAAVRNFALGHPPNEGLSNCGFGCLALTADGDAFPCNRVHEVECQGNIKNEGLAVVMEKVLRLHSATSVDEMVPCRNCDVRYICGGGCRIEDFMFRGKPTFVDHGGLLPGSEHVDQCTCDGEWKTSLYRKMIATTHYQFSFDAE
jgi:radical SAM protein with 4Fe4S-binding SPASM domain